MTLVKSIFWLQCDLNGSKSLSLVQSRCVLGVTKVRRSKSFDLFGLKSPNETVNPMTFAQSEMKGFSADAKLEGAQNNGRAVKTDACVNETLTVCHN